MILFIDGLIFGRERFGGVSRMWAEYLKRLPEHCPDIRLLIPRRHRNDWLDELISRKQNIHARNDYFSWPIRIMEQVPLRSRLLKIMISGSKVDIFHSTYYSTIYDQKITKILTVHDMILELFSRDFQSRHHLREIEKKKKAIANADIVIAVSENTKQDLIKVYPWIKPEKIEVIHHGAFIAESDLSFEEVQKKFHLNTQAEDYFLHVGRRGRYKNFKIVLSLIKEKPAYQNQVFLCVGGEKFDPKGISPDDREAMRNVIFLQNVSDRELAVLYRNAKALIFPSKYEGFGLPIIEAMKIGCPVICGEVASLPEIADSAGFYFDVDQVDSLDRAILRNQLANRREIVEKGKHNAARFSWESAIRKLVDLYTQAI